MVGRCPSLRWSGYKDFTPTMADVDHPNGIAVVDTDFDKPPYSDIQGQMLQIVGQSFLNAQIESLPDRSPKVFEVFQTFEKINMNISMEKFQCDTHIKFEGCILDSSRYSLHIQPAEDKMQKIRDLPLPTRYSLEW